MQSQIPISALIISLCASLFATDYQVANKKGFYEVESATMPYSLWTNSVVWITAKSPVLNAGATNAQWICYAKNCAGNFTQPVLASQPAAILTNGNRVLSFDGGDFLFYKGAADFIHQTGRFDIQLRVHLVSAINQRILSNTVGSTSESGVLIDNNASTIRFIVCDGFVGQLAININRPSATGWNEIRASCMDATNVLLTVNGSSITGTYAHAVANTTSASRLLGIGQAGSGGETGTPLTGLVDYLKIRDVR